MISLAWILMVVVGALPARAPDAMSIVGPGVYRPLFAPAPGQTEIPVAPFLLDRVPVTNADFLAFVNAHPEWRRDRVASLLADEAYLSRWASPGVLGPAVDPGRPVVDVSWFAARAYCAARGLRLPTEAQWELAAATPARIRADGPAWEWVLDFDASTLVGGDGVDALRTCGATGGASGDKTDFAAFERFAMRSALRARYTTHDLGFRCARSVSGGAS
jgi:formylglycine-generating enzyme required for sulfatase activity